MIDFFKKLFDSDFMPHGHCYLMRPEIIWLHVISDALITMAYFSIPITLMYFIRKRRDVPFHWIFVMFGVFIFACGTTHLLEIWSVWHGTYRLSGVVKAVTAISSIGTAIMLVQLIPQALTLPTPTALRRVNGELEKEIAERKQAQTALAAAHDNLEVLVNERTASLISVMDELAAELKAMTHLHELSTRLLETTEIQPLLDEVLTATIALNQADFGNVQLFNPKNQALVIVAQRGFRQDFLDYFASVHDEGAACGRAMSRGERIIIEDVLTDPAFEPHRAIAAAADFRAVQSTPLFSCGGEPLGMISTHFRRPHRPLDRHLRLTDLYARQAAELIDRKRAEEALRASEERFRRYFDLGLIGMAITSPAKGCLEVNDELCRMLGYERSELLQKTWAEMTHPDDLAADVENFDRVMEGEMDGYTLDKRWIRKDGSVVDTIMAAQSVRRADGSVDYFVGLVLDITERKLAEASLREANERTEMVLNSITDKFFGFDKDWRYTYFNKQAEEQVRSLGRDPAKLIGRTLWEEFPHPPAEEAFRQAMDERTVVTHEHFYPPLGEWIENRIYPSADGGLAIYQRYITDRKRAEERLRRSEANLAEGQRISHTGSWAWNSSSGEIFSSQELLRIFGLETVAILPTHETFLQLIHPEDRERIQQAFDGATRNRTEYEAEYRLVRPDGSLRHVHNLAHPVFSDSGALVEYIGTAMDITERKRAEEELRKTQAELTHVTRVSTMGELAASIAHEVNQPLGAIVNNASACLRLLGPAAGFPADARGALSDILADAYRASAVVARIRALTKRSAPEKTSLYLQDVVADVLALSQSELAKHRIEVRNELPEDLPDVSGDRVQLQQVLLNLVMNGIEAMSAVEDERRILTIRGQSDELDGKPSVRITVQDLGAGFKPEHSERLFEAFYTTKPHGMGMGLRISRSIVEAHGGRLWAKSNNVAGATFSCALPMEESIAA